MWNRPLISVSLQLRLRSGFVTKERDIIDSAKSQLPFMYIGSIWTFLIDLWAEVSRSRFQVFHCLAYFSEFSLIIIGFYLL